ncbi:MAG TPA: SRPBCC family protein [Polyangiales bacterium]|nr:SRPBCC family protein [Polyangiales bacterium]
MALALALAGVALWPEGRAEALQSGARAFSSQEERALRAGQLVVRPTEVVRGEARLMGGLSWQLISAPPERVWRTVNDVRAYPHFLPAVEEARLIEQVGAEQRLFIRHRLGFVNASYFVLATPDHAAARMSFRLDRTRPSSIRDAFGELRVTPYPDGRSVVSLAILADVGEGLVAGLVRSNVHEWMLRVPEQLKKYLEKAVRDEQSRSVAEAGDSARSG